jgi:hypothetical protein
MVETTSNVGVRIAHWDSVEPSERATKDPCPLGIRATQRLVPSVKLHNALPPRPSTCGKGVVTARANWASEGRECLKATATTIAAMMTQAQSHPCCGTAMGDHVDSMPDRATITIDHPARAAGARVGRSLAPRRVVGLLLRESAFRQDRVPRSRRRRQRRSSGGDVTRPMFLGSEAPSREARPRQRSSRASLSRQSSRSDDFEVSLPNHARSVAKHAYRHERADGGRSGSSPAGRGACGGRS